jgi:hypothetical protein
MILAWLQPLLLVRFLAMRSKWHGLRVQRISRQPFGVAKNRPTTFEGAGPFLLGRVTFRFPSALGPPFRRPSWMAAWPIRGGPG